MCSDDFEGVDLSSQWQRARKGHKCFACHEQIRSGDYYHRVVQLYDGRPDTFRHCARCWLMVEAITQANGSCQLDLNCGFAWEEIHGELPDSVAMLAFLTPQDAQRMVAS